MISIRALADELGRHPNKFHEFIKKHNYPIEKIKSHDIKNRGQIISVISNENANEIRAMLYNTAKLDTKQQSRYAGYFYIIQLEPEIEYNRIKLGWASNIHERLRKHQCSAPNSRILQFWECRSLWEKTIIDIVTLGETKLNNNKIETECFIVKDLNEVTAKINKFFDLLPK